MGWVSQATQKVSDAATQVLQPIEQGISQGVSDVGKTIANSPELEAVITVIATYNGVPPKVTAAFLAANKTSQTGGNLEKGLETLILSYGAGELTQAFKGVDIYQGLQAAASGGSDAAIVDAALGGAGADTAAVTSALPEYSVNQAVASGMSPGSMGAGLAADYTTMGGASALSGAAQGAAYGVGAGAGAAGLLSGAAAGTAAGAGAAGAAGALGAAASGLSAYGPALTIGALQAIGGANTAEKAREAAQTQAQAQVEAARIAADAAKFRPVGVTTRFGSSKFRTDAQGNVIGAGYTASPEIQGYQNRLSALAGQGLTDAEGARAAYAPLTTGAQSLFNLGQGYIQQTPEQQAADYIAKQQALLAPQRDRELSQLQNKLFQQGRIGSATAQGGNLMATNPEMAAYYNALAQSDLQLAAQGQQAGQQQAQFGAGLLGAGADLQNRYYTGQTGAYAPFATAIDTSSGLEGLASNALSLGTSIGAKTTAGNAQAGLLLGQGMTNSANTLAPGNAFSYSGNLFNQAANNPQLQDALRRAFAT